MFEIVKKFVDESFNEVSPHFERTVYWLKVLEPNSDEPMEIAAYAHDIARAFRMTNSAETFKDKELDDKNIIKEHQDNGAKIMSEFLIKRNYDENKIQLVYNIISKHEWGGDQKSNLIKDADSISYLEINAPKHAQKLSLILGKEKIKRKFDWMFNRITSKKAKEIAEPFYQKAIRLLNIN